MENKLLRENYLDQGYNCAEAVLRTANGQYGLGLDEKALYTAGGFGGGMGTGSCCGALCGCIEALGAAMLEGRARDCEGFREECAQLVHEFEEALGSQMCRELCPRYKREDVKCYEVVVTAYELLEKRLKK